LKSHSHIAPPNTRTLTKRLTTRQLLAKAPNVPCHYGHKTDGGYYRIKKLKGKEKEHSRDTAIVVQRLEATQALEYSTKPTTGERAPLQSVENDGSTRRITDSV
jgi:hypothetical protein